MATDPWGIDDGYFDVRGDWHPTSPETRTALRLAMTGDPGRPPEPPRPLWVVRTGAAEPLLGPCELRLEDGTAIRAEGALPPDLPVGYHDLHPLDGGPTTRLIVSPGRCHLPDDLRTWMLAVQLPACRSAASWGIGDLADLRAIGTWAAGRGAGMVAVSPLHAPLPLDRVEPSPYFPSSRRWAEPARAADRGRARGGRHPGRGRASGRRGPAAQRRTARRPRRGLGPQAAGARGAVGRPPAPTCGSTAGAPRWASDLETYARFCALAEHHGTGWHAWPERASPPRPPRRGRRSPRPTRDRVAFWAWLQFLLDDQLRRAEEPLPLLTDLAIGVDPDGADAWVMQDLLAHGVRIGRPTRRVQPLRAGLGPAAVRAARPARRGLHAPGPPLASGDGPRRRPAHRPRHGPVPAVLDPARAAGRPMVPTCATGATSCWPSSPSRARRAGAVVVGEDLGTVEPEVRTALADAGLLSYRLAWFEDGPPERVPPPGARRGHHARPADRGGGVDR